MEVAYANAKKSYDEGGVPIGAALVKQAEEAERQNDWETAKELYVRAGAVYRIARFPIIRSKLSRQAWEAGKAAYLKGGQYLDPPNQEVMMLFQYANSSAGDESRDIPAHPRIPNVKKPERGWPVLLFICGLDAYRPDFTDGMDAYTKAGFATLSVEIPGTSDSPAAPQDPQSPDRLWSSVLDWISSKRA